MYKIDIKINPYYDKAHNNLGIGLAAEGKNEESNSQNKMAIKIKPYYAKAHNNLETALLRSEELE